MSGVEVDGFYEQDVDWRSAYLYLEEQQEAILRTLADRLAELEKAKSSGHAVIRRVDIAPTEQGGVSATIAADGANLEYAFYLYRGDDLVEKHKYTLANTKVFSTRGPGTYRVRGFIRHVGAKKIIDTSASGGVEI